MKPVDKLKLSHTKITRPRKLVLEYLAKQQKPKTTQEICAALKNKVDQVSVYRTVELLKSLHIIFEECLLDEHRYYAADSPHHHVVCRKCKRVECLPCHVEFTPPKKFTDITHHLSLTGICAQCQ
ncbi:MAG: Fur family transcriptional regulator [Patescibacteria group bacterium]